MNESAVEHEHIRLTRQLERCTWEKGVAQGSHKRLRTGIETALTLLENGATDPVGVRRLLTELIRIDDQVLAHAVLKDDTVPA